MSNVTRMPNVSQQSWPSQNWSGSWPGCSCGCNPCQCGGGFGGLMQCWQDIAQFQQFLMAMLSQMGPIPIQGVTDGSDAKAGYVGEFVQMSASIPFPATPATTVVGSVGVLSPGDWNCTAWGQTSVIVGDISMTLSPFPPGFSSPMESRVQAPQIANWSALPPAFARASITVPTLIAMSIGTNYTQSAGFAGTFNAVFNARRAR